MSSEIPILPFEMRTRMPFFQSCVSKRERIKVSREFNQIILPRILDGEIVACFGTDILKKKIGIGNYCIYDHVACDEIKNTY